MNFEQMQNRITSRCVANEIVYQFNDGKEPDGAWGSYYLREIEIPPITDECSYATALHEVGHILGRYQLSEVILVRERWAWKWAKRSALGYPQAGPADYPIFRGKAEIDGQPSVAAAPKPKSMRRRRRKKPSTIAI